MTVVVQEKWFQYEVGFRIEDCWFEDGYCCWNTGPFTQAYVPEKIVKEIGVFIQLKLF